MRGKKNKVGLYLNELLSQQQVVMKSLEENFRGIKGIPAATILGDGRGALIVDVDGLYELSLQSEVTKKSPTPKKICKRKAKESTIPHNENEEALSSETELNNENDILEEQEVLQRYLTFMLDKEEYAIEISKEWEIRVWEKATYLPLTEHYVKGVINTRGSIIPIIDLRLRFGLVEIEPTQNTTIILVQIEDELRSRLLGIIVDEVCDIYDIPINDIQTELEAGGRSQKREVIGTININDKFLILLNQDQFLDVSMLQE